MLENEGSVQNYGNYLFNKCTVNRTLFEKVLIFRKYPLVQSDVKSRNSRNFRHICDKELLYTKRLVVDS